MGHGSQWGGGGRILLQMHKKIETKKSLQKSRPDY